jgi:predicted nucleic acid-binding protein
LLDTDILIDYLRGYPPARDFFAQLPADCAVSAVSVAELHVGVREGAERKALALLLAQAANHTKMLQRDQT